MSRWLSAVKRAFERGWVVNVQHVRALSVCVYGTRKQRLTANTRTRTRDATFHNIDQIISGIAIGIRIQL